MSAPDHGSASPPLGHTPGTHTEATPEEPNLATDPGRSRPYESLYRTGDSATAEHRATARHFEQWLTPPEETRPGDVFHWLYRPDPEPDPSPAGPQPPSEFSASIIDPEFGCGVAPEMS